MRHHLFHYDAWSDQAVRRWIKRVGPERIEDLYHAQRGRPARQGPDLRRGQDLAPLVALKAHVEKVLAEGAALSTRDLAIDGNDLMKELGLKPGRIIGQVLEALLEVVIADPAQNEREALLGHAREIVRELERPGVITSRACIRRTLGRSVASFVAS